MKTLHLLNHAACMVALELDEQSGQFDLRFRSSPLADPTFRRDLHRWCGQIGCGWARRTGLKANAVSLHFFQLPSPKGSRGYKGTFKLQMKG